jgi:glutamine amidotransferase
VCPVNSSESTNIAIIEVDLAGAIQLVDALTSLGANAIVTESMDVATNSAGLIIASSAGFETTIEKITAQRFDEVIERRLAGGRPVLGIGTGMQILFEKFEAYSAQAVGLGEWPGTIEEIGAFGKQRGGLIKVDAGENSKLFSEIKHESFWFENDAALKTWSLEVYGAFRRPSVSLTSGPEPFVAAVENGPLSAVQFLPEKSGNAGMKMLGNWINSL